MKLMIKCDLSYFKTRFIILEEPFQVVVTVVSKSKLSALIILLFAKFTRDKRVSYLNEPVVRLCFQFLAIYDNKMYQSRPTILPNTSINP